jgi:uncharacterized phage protein (TIGR02218 family)
MAISGALKAHLETGATTICRAWALVRGDGSTLGFTDHDCALAFDGTTFQPETGMTAKALSQGTGLSVDNTEVLGALSSEAIREADIMAGRYDGAEVRIWQVNWMNVSERALIFRGHLGEIERGDGAFSAELRSLTDSLGKHTGMIFHPGCSAVLGDTRCGFDLTAPGYSTEIAVEQVADGRVFSFSNLDAFADRWFEKGRLRILTGVAAGIAGVVKNDRLLASGGRAVELWQKLPAEVVKGDMLRIEAGCDRRPDTCRLKFSNFLNFRGFPHIPGDDWLTTYPTRAGVNDGGSLWR